MRKIPPFILLILHVNFSMLTPQVQEFDMYDISGKATDDLNSLVEFVDQVILNHCDNSPEDEDDDNAKNYGVAQFDFYYRNNKLEFFPHEWSITITPAFQECKTFEIPSISFDVLAPPPKA